MKFSGLSIEELAVSLHNITRCGRDKVRAKLVAIARQMTQKGEI